MTTKEKVIQANKNYEEAKRGKEMTDRDAQVFTILSRNIQILDLASQKSKYNAKSLMGINRQESKKLRQQLQAERRKRKAEKRAEKIREEMEKYDHHV